MDRDTRRLLNTKAREAQLDIAPPTPHTIQEGEGVYCIVDGKARLYKKLHGILFYWEGTIV